MGDVARARARCVAQCPVDPYFGSKSSSGACLGGARGPLTSRQVRLWFQQCAKSGAGRGEGGANVLGLGAGEPSARVFFGALRTSRTKKQTLDSSSLARPSTLPRACAHARPATMSAAARVLSGGLGRSAGRIAPPTFKAVTALRAAPIRTASAAESVAAIAASARILTPGTVGCVVGPSWRKDHGGGGRKKKSPHPCFLQSPHLLLSVSPFPFRSPASFKFGNAFGAGRALKKSAGVLRSQPSRGV
jgi:hypothetical protein